MIKQFFFQIVEIIFETPCTILIENKEFPLNPRDLFQSNLKAHLLTISKKRTNYSFIRSDKSLDKTENGFFRSWVERVSQFSFRLKAPSSLPLDGSLSLFTAHNGWCSSIFAMVSSIAFNCNMFQIKIIKLFWQKYL